MSKKPQTKQQKYKQKMRALGFKTLEVWSRQDDKAAIQAFATMIRIRREPSKKAA